MSRDYRLYLDDIRDAVRKISEYATGLCKEDLARVFRGSDESSRVLWPPRPQRVPGSGMPS